MAHNIDMTNGRANIAFVGSRADIWHRLGKQKQANESIDSWAVDAGLSHEVIKVPAIASLSGSQFDHIEPAKRFREVENRNFLVRSDNGHPLGYVSDRYQIVQPREILEWFDRYIAVDDRFKLDVAGSLKNGEIIWATATFNGDMKVGGDNHKARLLMTTTFDGTGSTINKGTMIRAVCNNTIDMALADKSATIRTRHNTKFDAAKVGRELAAIAKGFEQYKAIGDAMADVEMSKEQVSSFFKRILDVPFDAKRDDISARKSNQFGALNNAYRTSVREGAADGSVWAALQALTRYVDHDRTSGSDESRCLSSQFGSGAQLKEQAMGLLLPMVKDKVLVRA
jgi:phage/plasmid-like protein (TIGR03299 family)